MSFLKGDYHRAVGYGKVTVDGIEIDLSVASPQDVMEFQTVPMRAVQHRTQAQLKDFDNILIEDGLKVNEAWHKWFKDFFFKYAKLDKIDNKQEREEEEKALLKFIYANRTELQKQFTIGFGLMSKEELEEKEKSDKDEKSKK